MRQINKSRLESYVENYLRMKPSKTEQGLNYLRKAKAYIDYALIYRKCDFTEPVLNMYTLLENQFTKTVYNMMLNIGIDKFRQSLLRTSQMLKDYITEAECECSLVEFTTNHTLKVTPLLQGYASIESGGDKAYFEFKANGRICTPYTMTISTDFGAGPVIAETLNVTSSSFIYKQDVLDWIIGKSVNIGSGNRTVVLDSVTPTASEINKNTLNGRRPKVIVDITDCNNTAKSYSLDIDLEMKRRTKVVLYTRQEATGGCRCAENASELYPDRRGGTSFRAPGIRLGSALPTCSVNSQRIFNNLFSGNANAKWRSSDVYNALGGFHPNVSFRNPTVQVFDALVTQGNGSQINCMFGFVGVVIDYRDTDTFSLIPTVHFSSVSPCPPEPISWGSIFSYNVSNDTYNSTVQVGDIVNVGAGTSAIVQSVETPASLGW